jgi:hypothetical protein
MITNQSCCDAADNAHTTASREAPGSHIIDYLKSIDRTWFSIGLIFLTIGVSRSSGCRSADWQGVL